MTADNSGNGVARVLRAFGRMREQWILVAAFATALFWARDTAEVYMDLPLAVSRQESRVAVLADRLDGLADRVDAVVARRAICPAGGSSGWSRRARAGSSQDAAPGKTAAHVPTCPTRP